MRLYFVPVRVAVLPASSSIFILFFIFDHHAATTRCLYVRSYLCLFCHLCLSLPTVDLVVCFEHNTVIVFCQRSLSVYAYMCEGLCMKLIPAPFSVTLSAYTYIYICTFIYILLRLFLSQHHHEARVSWAWIVCMSVHWRCGMHCCVALVVALTPRTHILLECITATATLCVRVYEVCLMWPLASHNNCVFLAIGPPPHRCVE